MDWRITENCFGGQTIAIPPGCDLAKIPEEFQPHIDDSYRSAFADAGYFAVLAEQCEVEQLARFYQAVAKLGGAVLEVNVATPAPGHTQTETLFRVRDRGGVRLGFRLPHHVLRHYLPAGLKQLYASIDGTVEGAVWESGGLLSANDIGMDLSLFPLESPEGFVEADGGIMNFYNNGFGDMLFARQDKAVWFRHEDCNFKEAGPLDEVINRYFASLLDGGEWVTDPYATR